MAYHFRKLRQTLRLIPSTKSIGFSTCVSEGDQKNTHLDGSPAISHADGIPGGLSSDTSIENVGDGLSSASTAAPCTLSRSQSDSDLFNNLQPFLRARTTTLPVAYKDIAQVLLPRLFDEYDSEEKDPVFSVVKPVGFTSDDILVNASNSFGEYNNATLSVREHIPIDVITLNYHRRLGKELTPSRCNLQPVDNIVLSHSSPRTYGGDCVGQPHVSYAFSSDPSASPKVNGNSKDGPSPEQMMKARDKLEQLVMTIFKGQHGYDMLHKNVVLENNLFGENTTAIGLPAYKFELYKLRLYIRIQLFSLSMEILSITNLEQSGVIRIHWRLRGLPQTQNLKFWRLFQSKESISKDDWEWLEAFSYFHIGKDGLVHKHRIDRMLPDNGQADLTEKLRGFLQPAKPLVN